MTTRTTHFVDASSARSAPSSPALEVRAELVSGTDASVRVITHLNPIAQGATGPCVVYRFQPRPEQVEPASFSDFDDLVAELESSPESAARLAEGRRWVGATFYGDRPTLASLRLAAGLSQRQLGHACGLDQPHVSRYESGKHEPRIALAAAMAEALGTRLEVFAQAWRNTREAFHDLDAK